MGICKCRKRTDLFCYHCQKAVCYDCMVEEGHALSKIATYEDWLNNATNPPPTCALSGRPINSTSESIRFTNLKLYHLEAINEYGSSKPKSTALAGYTIPELRIPMVPPVEDQSKLAQQIREKLSRFEWISELIALQHETRSPDPKTPTDPASDSLHLSDRLPPAQNGFNSSQPAQYSGMSARKQAQTEVTVEIPPRLVDDDPQFKYRPKPIRKFFEALGFISETTTTKAKDYRFKGKGMVIFVGALLFTLAVVIFLGMNMSETIVAEDPIGISEN
eukprot:TRINITY_DN19181_c0_g1_i2.p1 TRINITY_DN19181_c0_g1~~TRINITY_DN19181_c0_g1_i2.p1  ORF type:complete len:276 (-),score=47.34 TRINITY_DN19181_c0_g1_i2:111-938(-)